MTWRAGKFVTRLPLVAFALVFVAGGCGPSEKDRKIQDLTAENEELKNELNDRDRQLTDAMGRENDARATIDALNREMARVRAQTNDAPKTVDGWITTTNFDMISVPGEVLFPSGKAELSSSGRTTLNKLAADIRDRYSDRDIYVMGHTDNDPIRKSKWKDNWELGAMRSLTVVRTLSQMGISPDSIIQANCGEYRPRSSNADRGSKSQNRRVEFYAVLRGGPIVESAASSGAYGE